MMKKDYNKELTAVYENAGYFSLALFVLVLLGFFKTYFGLYPGFNATITNVTHFHAFVMMSWVLLLIVQPFLIRYRHYHLHRILGKSTYVLAPLIVASLISLMFKHYYDDHMDVEHRPTADIIKAFYFQAVHTIMFATFYILAMVYRRNPILHASYMIATGIVFLKPSIVRIFFFWLHFSYPATETITVIIVDLCVFGLFLFATSRTLNSRLYLLVLALFLCYHIPRMIQIWL
jgi:hypothetical protein